MIRKLFLLPIIVLALCAPILTHAGYEIARQVIATNVVDPLNNFVLVDSNGEDILIHHQTGCGDVHEGTKLTLVIRGDLDGNLDEMWNGDSQSCAIDQAEPITGTMVVTTFSPSDTYTSVSDNGKPYRIFYSERCKSMSAMGRKEVYVHKYGTELRAGDRFFLPGAGEVCAITYVESELVTPPEPKPDTGDTKRPTTPTHFRAIPSTDSVYLYWDAAQDDGGIAYYVISASLYHRDDPVARDPDVKPQEMQDTFKTSSNDNHLRVTGLLPDEQYFFRIIAVDNAGNESSYWSEEATAFTKSSISQIGLENERLRLFEAQETEDSFLFRWTNLSGCRFSVSLEVDGERVLAESEWFRPYIRVLKKPERKGKEMKLIVRSLNSLGISQKASTTFSF